MPFNPQFSLDPRGEGNQAVVRCIATLIVFLLLFVLGNSGFSAQVWPILPSGTAYLGFGLVWIPVVGFDLFNDEIRKWMTIALDHGLLASCIASGGAVGALIMWAPIFATTGYGLRFGPKYARRSLLVSTPALLVALLNSAYWRDNIFFASGLLLANLTLPIYAFRLAHFIELSKEKAEEHAHELEETSRRDPLTGLLNRLGLENALSACACSMHDAYVMYVDLDNFKAVNDKLGHTTGDHVLTEAAGILRKSLRSTDVIARVGGDEFIVFINETTAEHCEHVAAKISSALERLRLDEMGGEIVGASIGFAPIKHPHATALNAAIDEADRMMYEAKRGRKLRTRCADCLVGAMPIEST